MILLHEASKRDVLAEFRAHPFVGLREGYSLPQM